MILKNPVRDKGSSTKNILGGPANAFLQSRKPAGVSTQFSLADFFTVMFQFHMSSFKGAPGSFAREFG
jgi:hypothetical protein